MIQKISERGDELIGHGVDMGKLHYGGMDDKEEKALITESLKVLREASGQPVTGWWSPAKSQSWKTMQNLASNGITYCCDWSNDDMPYQMKEGAGNLWAMPHGDEIWDRTIILDKKHNEDEFVEELEDAFSVLYKETDQYGGRILSIVLTPYIMGLHYRIKYLDKILGWITGHDGVWSATGSEILNAFKQQAK